MSSTVRFIAVFLAAGVFAARAADSWTNAWQQAPMTVAETRTFMRELAQYVFDHHLKKDARSAQRGMVYEYFDTTRAGKFDQWVQGEALDTMHDGAWFAAALVNAFRATGDQFYKELLTQWVLPFYVKMLNQSETLFSTARDDSRTNAVRFNREHQLQDGEKGFVPYWWDDGASVSLERVRDRNPRGPFSCTDEIPPEKNTNHVLKGFSHGSSNHLAQDLGVMLELAWLLLNDSENAGDKQLAREVAEAATNLHACRMRHHGNIPMCDAPAALANNDATLMASVPSYDGMKLRQPENHFFRALYVAKAGARESFAGFADDQEYLYYAALAKHRALPRSLAFKLAYDALTEPMLFHFYCDDAPLVPGINRFDLHPYFARDGKLEDYRSDRKGPSKQARPIGSRFGPQNMVVCGWALQALNVYGDLWEERVNADAANDQPVMIDELPPGLERAMEPPFARFDLGGATLGFSSTTRALVLHGECDASGCDVKLFSRPDATGMVAVVTVSAEKISAQCDGETLLIENASVERAGKKLKFRATIPYSVVKAQKPWWNGVPHARYSVQVGEAMQNLYFTSEEEQTKRWLTWELAGGLRTWQAIFRERGYIPTGIGAGPSWDKFSDSGGYAHLISAAAQWIFLLEGKRDWEQHLGKLRVDG
jgi:hypothetical protein